MSGDRPALVTDPAGQPDGSEAGAEVVQNPEAAQREWGQFTLEEVIRPTAIAALLTCIAIAVSQFVESFSSDWPAGIFAALTFLVCLESIHAQRLLSRRRLPSSDHYRFRFVEWVMILLAVRFARYARLGSARLVADVSSWTSNIISLFDLYFIVTSLLLFGFWYLALYMSRTIQELEASPIEKMPSITDPGFYLRSTMPHHGRTDRQGRLDRIVSIFFWCGAFLLLLTGLGQVDVRDLVMLSHSRSSGIILNVLVYFLIGLLIISQAQYTIHKANWELQGIPILDKMGQRWVLLVAGFLVLIGTISALLPVSYSVGILGTLYAVVRWIIYAVVQIAFLLLFALSYVLGLIFSLFKGQSGEASTPEITRVPTPPPPPTVASEPALWWQVARSLIFWAIVTGVVGYSLIHFFRDRWGLFQGVSAGRLLGWLGRFWRALGRGSRRAVSRIRQEIAIRLAARRARLAQSPWRFLSLRRLGPRERVRYFYLSTLRRSADLGLGRPPALTPLEYQQVLAGAFPDVDQDVHALTTAFIEARYSEHSISRENAATIQSVWRSVRRALTLRRRSSRGASPERPHDASEAER